MRAQPIGSTTLAKSNASLSSSRLVSNGSRRLADTRVAVGPLDRERLLDRLNRLSTILPAFAEELARSRRQAAALRVENRGLLAEVRRLQRLSAPSGSPRTPLDAD